MTNSSFSACSVKHFFLTSVATAALMLGPKAGALSIIIHDTLRYEGVSCDKLMDVYRRAYVSAGFKFDGTKMFVPDAPEMNFTFSNPKEPKSPPGGGSIRFYLSKNKESCEMKNYIFGVLDYSEVYSVEQYTEFEKLVLAADAKARALIRKRVGLPKLVRD